MAAARRRILVIEDDRETAAQLADALAANGYQVDLAVDGNGGLTCGRSAEYAVMTIDRMLPDIDGLAVIRRLREDPSAVEELAREELGLIKDGELLIILRDTPPSTAQPSSCRCRPRCPCRACRRLSSTRGCRWGSSYC